MDTNNIPVSFDFFKKNTYYDECVEFMLKFKAQGNEQMYEALLNNKDAKEQALKAYYEAFYLKPKIRERYHIRLKSVPKKVKDKLLQIPVMDCCVRNEIMTENAIRDPVTLSSNKEVVQIQTNNDSIGKESKRRTILGTKKDMWEEELLVEDDTEPLSSPDVPSNLKDINEKLNMSDENQNKEEKAALSSKAFIDKENTDIRALENDKEDNCQISSGIQQNDRNTAPPTSANKTLNINYEHLIPYVHCCPLTFKEFRKYSNINELFGEFAKKRKLNAEQARIARQRSYMLFYLAPEHRKIALINKIQVLDQSPQHIKDIFFNIPTNLYAKEKNNAINTKNVMVERGNDINKNNNVTKPPNIIPEATDLSVVDQQKTNNNNTITNNVNQQIITIPSQITTAAVSTIRHKEINNDAVQITTNKAFDDNHTQTLSAPLTNPALKSPDKPVEDCNQLLSSSDIPSNLKGINKKLSSSTENQKIIKRVPFKDKDDSRVMENDKEETCINTSDMQQNSEKTAEVNPSTSTDNQSPRHIKDKFFNISTNLYAKEQNAFETKNTMVQIPNDIIISRRYVASPPTVVSVATSTTTELHANASAVKQQKLNDSSEKLNRVAQQIIIPGGQITSAPKIVAATVSNCCRSEINNEATQLTTYKTIDNLSRTKILPLSTNPTNDPLLDLPFTLEEFKKYTHYMDIIETLFKLKARDNHDLYIKYKNSPEAFVKTLENYYRAFYLLPVVREICPIRIKPIPNFLKSRLLQIPKCVNVTTSCNNFKLEQLVAPELTLSSTNEKESLNTIHLSREEIIEEQSKGKEEVLNISNCSSTYTVTTIKTEVSNSPSSSGIKRANGEDSDSPSPKRQKTQQTEINNHKTKTSLYKELSPYSHCCPVSFSQFRKYTNVSDLFTGYCRKRYKGDTKLPFMLRRAYILYYLAPKYRKFRPFTELKLSSECPIDLRDKIFEIPTNLYLKEPNEKNLETEAQTKIKIEELTVPNENNCETNLSQQAAATTKQQQKNRIKIKEPITILENRLLPPTTLPFSIPCIKESQCSTEKCIFYHVSYNDFMKLTNILSILPEPQEIIVIQKVFKKFIYKVIKEQTYDENYLVNCDLMCKILKYNFICESCENDVRTLLKLESTSISPAHCAKERILNPCKETITETLAVNSESMQHTMESATNKEQTGQGPLNNKSLTTNQTKSLNNNILDRQETNKMPSTHLWKCLRKEKIFSIFRKKLLAKLSQSFDDTVDFTADTYKIFLQCNEIPIKQILNIFCDNNEDIVQRISNDMELIEALQRYYYYKYLTDKNFAFKYPVKLKQRDCPEKLNKRNEGEAERSGEKTDNSNDNTNNCKANTLDRNELTLNKINSIVEKPTATQQENSNNLSLGPENALSNNNALEAAKRIFFRNVEKTNTLPYLLRTSFHFKQLILRKVLSLTFKEFLEITNIYEGQELYTDKHVAECMYRYVFCKPGVWPTNLYITLKKLCTFLYRKNIRFDDYSTMLTYISPKLLHWSVMLSCTNVLDSVNIDFEKRTGKFLDFYDTKTLKQECIEYYNRCWKQEKWLGQTPLLNKEFCTEILNEIDQDDVTMLDEPAAEEICQESPKIANNVAATKKDCAPDFEKEVTAETNFEAAISTDSGSAVAEFKCVMLPNTQQQIEMLPPEEIVSNDPLNESDREDVNLNVSFETTESYDVESLGELTTLPIKSEPIDKKLLSNLLFYEDDKGAIKCDNCEEEIIDLDVTLQLPIVEENLPPSQIDFEETAQCLQVNNLNNGSDSLMQMAQYIPNSSSESNDTIEYKQHLTNQSPQTDQITTSPLEESPVVSLISSEENENSENIEENNLQDINEQDLGQNEFVQNVQTCLDLQSLPSTFENAKRCCDSSSEEAANIPLQLQDIGVTTPEQTATTDEQQRDNSALKTTQTFGASKQPSDVNKSGLPLRRPLMKTNAPKRNTKNVAKVKPVNKLDLVPQIQHNTRPLQTVPVHTTGNSKDNQQLMPPAAEEGLAQNTIILSLTATTSNSNSSQKSSQNSTFQLQLSPLDTHIYISQELNKNVSIFDNTSLLRIVDHNYHQQNTTNLSSVTSQTSNEVSSRNLNTVEEQQQLPAANEAANLNPNQITTSGNTLANNNGNLSNAATTSAQTSSHVCTEIVTRQSANEQTQQTNEQPVPTRRHSSYPVSRQSQFASTSNTQEQASPRIVTRRYSSLTNETKEVNSLALTHTNNNLVATIHQPLLMVGYQHHLYKIERKLCLHREVIKFHYFKELTSHHIKQYLLPSLEIGKSYTEALVVCENFKTRISNRSISALFPFWSPTLQRDFLLVLNDLKEFHYVAYERISMQKQEDLRARILFWLLNTAPSFALCQFIYEANNTEFSHCESIKTGNNSSYERKPFKCLTNALSPKVLQKLRNMKLNLNTC